MPCCSAIRTAALRGVSTCIDQRVDIYWRIAFFAFNSRTDTVSNSDGALAGTAVFWDSQNTDSLSFYHRVVNFFLGKLARV